MSRGASLKARSDWPAFNRPIFTLRPHEPDHELLRSIPDLISFNAVNNPQSAFCYQSSGSGDQLRYELFTFEQFAAAVGHCCEWILENVPGAGAGKHDSHGPRSKSMPVALFMDNDISLFTYVCALLALEIPCVLLSIRLSPPALHNLLRETSTCSIVCSPRLLANLVHSILPGIASVTCAAPVSKDVSSLARHLRRLELASVSVREEDVNVVMLHSSGTTGLPKPIWLPQRYLLGYATCHEYPSDTDESQRGINLSTLPIYHGFGFLAPCLSLSVGKPVCFLPTSTIPNGTLVARILRDERMTSLMTVPTIMEALMTLTDSEDVAKMLQALDFVAVGGGGMKEAVSLWFSSRNIPLLNHFGATELGALAPIFRPYSGYDPRFLRIRRDMGLRLELEESGSNDQQTSGPRMCRLIGYQFGSNQEYVLPDALECNPLSPNNEVRILGRNDDVLVLASGEKVMTTLIEREVDQCSSIKRAVVLGHHQFEVGLLVEPMSVDTSPEVIVDDLWPYIEKANAVVDRHARIQRKDAVLIKRAEQVIPLSDKGSVMRSELYKAFEHDIADLYRRLDSTTSAGFAIDPSAPDASVLIRQLVQTCLPEYQDSTALADDEDFIQLGLDSLQITRLRRLLDACLGKHNPRHPGLARDFVYAYPSVRQIVDGLSAPKAPGTVEDRTCAMTRMVSNPEFSMRPIALAGPNADDAVILVTGSSGSLGCHLVQALAGLGAVRRIICLVRSTKAAVADLREKLHRSLYQRGISLHPDSWAKIECVAWDTTKDMLGLGTDSYQQLVRSVTHVFHGAWPLDFQWKLESFSLNFRHVRQLLDLAQAIHTSRPCIKPRIVLASSIAVVAYTGKTVVSESPVNAAATAPIGYAEAKWVCEKLFEKAGNHPNVSLDPIIIRIGQLSGARQSGQWNHTEHIPALIQSAQKLGAFPSLEGSLSWLPVDQAAAVVGEILLGRHQKSGFVYHVENPIRQNWSDVLTVLERSLGISRPRISFAEWLCEATAEGTMQPNLTQFFRNHFQQLATGGVVLDTRHSRAISRTLCEVGGISSHDIDVYLKHWRSIDFLEGE